MTFKVRNNALKLLSTSVASEQYRRSSLPSDTPFGIDVFREMTDNALQGIMLHRSHEVIYVNRAWADLHGMTVDEVMSLPTLLCLIHPSEIKRMRSYASDRLQGGNPPARYRYRALHKNGRPIWLEQFVRLIDWPGERVIQSTVIDVDDQERKADALRRQRTSMKHEARQRSEALIRSNRQLHIHQSVIDQMSERITVIGTDYCLRMTNRANLQFRQKTREELIGVHVRETIGDDWFDKRAKALLDRSFEGYTEQYERETVGPDGRRCHVEVTVEPFRDPDGTISGAIISLRDVTAARKAEEQLRLVASVVEQISDRISVIGTDYRCRLINKAERNYLQLPTEALLNRPLCDVIGKNEFFARAKPELDQCLTGETVRTRRTSKDADGRTFVHDVLLEPYRESDGQITGAVVILRDVTEAQRLSERLAYQARYDQLTGLINRRAFEQLLDASIAETSGGGRSDVLCFIDLDQFKVVNDTVGHLAGDHLLQQAAKLLSAKLNRGDVLARLGGDEFGLLLYRCSLRRAKRAAEQLIAALKGFQFFHEGLMFQLGASIGIAAINRHVTSASDIMAQADLACYAAKDNGRNRVEIYKERDAFIRRRREEMYRAGGIRTALDRNQFILFSQPIVAIGGDDQKTNRVEILLRMKEEQGGLIMPAAFIPAAERYGFMAEVDRWVIRNTIAELAGQVAPLARIDVSINLSGVTLNDETSLEFIRRTLFASGLLPEQISFEITETAAIRNVAKTQTFMDELRSWGCRFALDDFGSGLSSLTYLKRLPVDFLKIDGSFVRDVAKDHGSLAMVKAIHQMAKELGIQTVAEGVEDLSTLDALKGLGIDYVQGFAIGRPASFAKIAPMSVH